MKPIRVRFGCFGPYVAQQEIDFQALEKNGLFLICGETGAGKTTILDAICYALYGRSSGGQRGDLSVMRCKLAQKEQETFTEFTFESGGEIYQFVRRLKYGRKNLNDSHNCLKYTDGVFVPIFENPKLNNVNKKAEELIGLSYEQFCQVIILPQGQFERLLVSDSAEKEKILVTLFHADRWQKITDEITRRVQEQDKKLQQERSQMDAKLREYGCTFVEELSGKIETTASALTQMEADWQDAQTRLAACRKENEAAVLENREFEQLDSLKKAFEKLHGRIAAMDAEESRLSLAERAEQLQPQFRQYQTALEAEQKARKQHTAALSLLEAAKKQFQKQQASQQQHDASRPEYLRRQKELVLMENAREIYARIPIVQKNAQEAEKRLDSAIHAYRLASREKNAAEQEKIKAIEAQNRAIGENQRIQTAYLQNIGYTLAKELTEGQPCPVCGSVHHPSPAVATGEHVSQEQLERSAQAVDAALRRASEAEKKLSDALAVQDRRKSEGETARADSKAAAQELDMVLTQRLEGIDTPDQLENKLAAYHAANAEFEAAEGRMQQRMNEANAAVLSAEQNVSTWQKAWEQAQAAFRQEERIWRQALAEAGFSGESAYQASCMGTEEARRRRTALVQFRTQLEGARADYEAKAAALADRPRPDLSGIAARLWQLERDAQQCNEQKILQRNALQKMTADREKLTAREQVYQRCRTETDGDLEYANRLRGRSGVSLQRYVLGVMLSAITVEANRLLSQVYGGRYRLYRTDAISGSGHKGGLELEVYDDQNNQRRSVTTLSGGEKFLVALSLAIGLSTVVQSQGHGIRLEAMFIDEGFGSLDREAVLDALEVLRSIQQGHGTVGIISHVETLTEIIPTRLEITKGKQGSKCRIVG